MFSMSHLTTFTKDLHRPFFLLLVHIFLSSFLSSTLTLPQSTPLALTLSLFTLFHVFSTFTVVFLFSSFAVVDSTATVSGGFSPAASSLALSVQLPLPFPGGRSMALSATVTVRQPNTTHNSFTTWEAFR
ncbi:hypothetical protein MtrunA17_Chr8g0385741 [Medicago truncatula]|uniref:Transmembrane protein n=1 Tax=Medicago truncatula TaxID=3880 RepID=A0A396GX90_MEDTR|nr:hypothetical protein MtrunA17_Chr8g0385741 [Medicago truncatula]